MAIPKFAGRTDKTELYKFRPYRTDKDKDRAHEILKESKIYFSRASQINDPFDMSPRYKVPTREELLEAARSYMHRNRDQLAKRSVDLGYLEACDIDEHIARATEQSRATIENNYWVFSMAGNRDHPLLWAHYAGGHTGLAIHLRCNENSIFGAAQRVRYVKTRPILPVTMGELSPREIFELIALTKGEFWRYEEEFRWLRFPDLDWSGVPIRFEGQYAVVSSTEIQGITVGARMRDPEIAQILEIANAHVSGLPVWHAVETDSFDFEFRELN